MLIQYSSAICEIVGEYGIGANLESELDLPGYLVLIPSRELYCEWAKDINRRSVAIAVIIFVKVACILFYKRENSLIKTIRKLI